MRRAGILGLMAVLAAAGCGGGRSLLPDEAELEGYSNLDSPEYYSPASLYAYMNGAAELYLEYGCSGLSVRRYGRDSDRLVVELFEMQNPQAAAALYTFGRRPGAEREIGPGCTGSVTPSEIQLSKGPYYLTCRNEDPMAQDGGSVLELCRQIAGQLAGQSSIDTLFTILPVESRHPGSEIAVSGPIALNVRPWLQSLDTRGFERAWIASYELAEGTAEAVLAEYSDRESASAAVRELATKPQPELWSVVKDRRVALVRGDSVRQDRRQALANKLLSDSQ